MRRFAWQIGGIAVALGAVLALGILVFACGSPTTVHLSPAATSTPRPSPTVDPRVAEVEAAATRYVEALDNAMKTGSPQELDSLSVPGSQAQGNAGISAHVLRNTSKTFVVTSVSYRSIHVDLGSASAVATLDYSITGFDAAWPSLKALAAPTTVSEHQTFEFDLQGGVWLVSAVR